MKSEMYLMLIVKKWKQSQNKIQIPWQTKNCENEFIKMYSLYLVLKRREEMKKRKFWVRSIFREEQRLLQGASNNLIVEMRNLDQEKYFDFLRIDVETFEELLDLIKPKITKLKGVRNPIPAKTRLEICLRYLASRDYMMSISYVFRVAPNTISKIIAETCEAIWDVLSNIVFPEPSENIWMMKATAFKNQWDFPNCIGSIDGKHIVVQAPPKSSSTFFNYKRQHSIVLLAVTDADGLFTIVDIGAEGRHSDGGVFVNSELGQRFIRNNLNLPAPTSLEENGPAIPFVLVGDEAFALTTYMMRPYSRRTNLDLAQKVFNYRLSRARRSVECSFGILSSRWRIFRKTIETSVPTAKKIVQASVCLHNFLMMKDFKLSLQERRYSVLPVEKYNSSGLKNVKRPYTLNENLTNATEVRDAFKNYFCSSGAIDQQWEKALDNNF